MLSERVELVGFGEQGDVVALVGAGTPGWVAVPVGFGGWVGGVGAVWSRWKNPKAKITANNIPMKTTNSFGDLALLILVLMLE